MHFLLPCEQNRAEVISFEGSVKNRIFFINNIFSKYVINVGFCGLAHSSRAGNVAYVLGTVSDTDAIKNSQRIHESFFFVWRLCSF